MRGYSFVNRSEYFQMVTSLARAAKPGERVLVAAMGFDPTEPIIRTLVEALKTAAQNGARVTLLVDALNFLADNRGLPGPLFYHRSLENLKGTYAATMQALKSIEAAGGAYCITNLPRRRFHPAPVGRSHIKGAVIGNQVFVGGCNLERPRQIDVMVTWTDTKAADTLATWLLDIAAAGSARSAFGDVDADIALDNTTRLLLDAGVPRQSIIYEAAMQLIDTAEEWLLITCQYFPGGETARHLAAAQARGVRVEIDYSHPRSHGTLRHLQHAHQLIQQRRRLPANFFSGRLDKTLPKLHAKVLASEKQAMVGSHNYVIYGVNFGTAELCLHSSDPAFAIQLRAYMHTQLHAAQNPATVLPSQR